MTIPSDSQSFDEFLLVKVVEVAAETDVLVHFDEISHHLYILGGGDLTEVIHRLCAVRAEALRVERRVRGTLQVRHTQNVQLAATAGHREGGAVSQTGLLVIILVSDCFRARRLQVILLQQQNIFRRSCLMTRSRLFEVDDGGEQPDMTSVRGNQTGPQYVFQGREPVADATTSPLVPVTEHEERIV